MFWIEFAFWNNGQDGQNIHERNQVCSPWFGVRAPNKNVLATDTVIKQGRRSDQTFWENAHCHRAVQ